jgi:hypothetical protein
MAYSVDYTREQQIRIVAAGLTGWECQFCPLCDDMYVVADGNPGLEEHCRAKGDEAHLVLSVMDG